MTPERGEGIGVSRERGRIPVAAPPAAVPAARASLPPGVLLPPIEVDVRTSVVAAFSFLLHFLIAGSLYSDWVDSVVDTERTVFGVVDALPPLALPDRAIESAPVGRTPAEARNANASPPRRTANPNPSTPRSTADVSLSRGLDRIQMQTMGALVGKRPATSVVLRGEVATTLLDDAAQSAAAVSDGGIRLAPRAGAPLRPGERAGSLSDLGNPNRSVVLEETGRIARRARPRGGVVTPAFEPPARVPGADAVIAGMRAGFRRCYQRALDQYPDAKGSLRLTLRVAPNGEVAGVGVAASGNLPGSLSSCVSERANAARFAAPEGGAAVVIVPVSFVKQ
jgi:hypothetical protein